jgi:hypothetical protein
MSRLQGKYLASSAVDARVLATDAVETAKIKNAAVTAEKIADGAINAMSKIDSGILNVASGLVQLNGSNKIPANLLPNAVMEYMGVWDASTNTPALADGAGNDDIAIGNVYRVGVAGSVDLGSGSISFEVGDYAILNADKVWEKSDTTDSVASVNGKQGVVVLTTSDIEEGTNLYYTDARAKAAAVADEIVDGVTDVAPSQNAVFDALALKASQADYVTLEGRVTTAEGDIDALETAVANAAAKNYLHTLTAGEIAARSFALPVAPIVASLGSTILYPVGGIPQTHGIDFTISGSDVTWPELTGLGELGLIEGDQIQVVYY